MAIFNGDSENEEASNQHFAEKTAKLIKIQKDYTKSMIKLGAYVFCIGKHTLGNTAKILKKVSRFFTARLKGACSKCLVPIKKLCTTAASPFINCKNGCCCLKASLSERKNQEGIFSATKLFFSTAGKSAWKSKGIFTTVFNYAAPVIAIVFLVNVVKLASEIEYAISVECNGQVLGYVQEEAVFEQAQKVMQDRITYVAGDETIQVIPKFSVKAVDNDVQVVEVDELADAMIVSADVPIIEAFGFYINGEFKGAVIDKSNIEKTLSDILQSHSTGTPGEVITFVDDYELKSGFYLENGIVDENEVISSLVSLEQVESYYTVESGDSPTVIAQKVGVPYSELKMLNPNIETSCFIGDQIILNRAEPVASVRVTRTEEYDVQIDYETIKIDDSTKYKGTETVLVKGAEGVSRVTAEVSYINGYEETRAILDQTVVVEKIDKKVAVGTKSTGASQAAIASSGRFMWPVGGTGGYISSPFGYRTLNGRREYHQGIDIAAPYGTPIYAADDGYVTMSKTNSSYGRCVKIDHGDGYTTLYSHASKLIVGAGTYVNKGDLIALVGATGRAYGNHLHFEVIYGGSKVNPAGYLSKK